MDVSWNFYEGIIVVVGLSLVGRYIEQVQLAKNADAIKALMKIQAKDALVMRDGQEVRIPLEQVRVDDLIIVKPGESIPVDGTVQMGMSEVDESMITGESMPVAKTIDDQVIGGTINVNGLLHIRATKL
ncbi:HAD-IC family P-type ATPase [Patescibacteria group bacterium]|nr:HAD-IC family P-type ATPase [Patescibacteria group bacterium]